VPIDVPEGASDDQRDAALLAAAAGGDAAAFDQLYRRHERRVWRFVLGMVHDRAVAEELVVDTMLAVWRGAKDFRAGSLVSTWILGIARYKALDAVRRLVQRRREAALDEAAEVADATPGPAEEASEADRARVLDQACRTLTAEHQEVLHLAFAEGLPYEQIAKLLDVPENTVKTRVHHAKRKLRDAFQRLTCEEPAP